MERTQLEASLSGHFPADLVEAALGSFEQMVNEYRLGRHGPAELGAAHFAEAVFRMLQQELLVGPATPLGQQLPNTTTLLNQFRQSTNGDRILKIDMPQCLDAVYVIRNSRGVGHVPGEVDPNRMDAVFVRAVCSWVLAELIRRYHGCPAAEAQAIVDALVDREVPLVEDVEGLLRVLDPNMRCSDQVMVLLYHSSEEWVPDADLLASTEYSNASQFRTRLLRTLHDQRKLEYRDGSCKILPPGLRYVEENLAPQ